MPNYYSSRFYRPNFEPVVEIGDVVDLIQTQGQHVYLEVEYIDARPKLNEVDFGALANGGTIDFVAALVANQDVLQCGWNEFLQLRWALNPNDFVIPPNLPVVNPAQVYMSEPYGGNPRWNEQNNSSWWDIRAQNLWDTLAPTEVFSYYNQTPQFKLVNNTGSDMAHTRISFYGIAYIGTVLGVQAPPAPAIAETHASKSIAGRIVPLPISARTGQSGPNVGVNAAALGVD